MNFRPGTPGTDNVDTPLHPPRLSILTTWLGARSGAAAMGNLVLKLGMHQSAAGDR